MYKVLVNIKTIHFGVISGYDSATGYGTKEEAEQGKNWLILNWRKLAYPELYSIDDNIIPDGTELKFDGVKIKPQTEN